MGRQSPPPLLVGISFETLHEAVLIRLAVIPFSSLKTDVVYGGHWGHVPPIFCNYDEKFFVLFEEVPV